MRERVTTQIPKVYMVSSKVLIILIIAIPEKVVYVRFDDYSTAIPPPPEPGCNVVAVLLPGQIWCAVAEGCYWMVNFHPR